MREDIPLAQPSSDGGGRDAQNGRYLERREILVGITSLLVGLALRVVLGVPRELVALVAAIAVGLIVSLLVTLFWKVSVHVAVVAGAITILTLVFGPLLLGLVPHVGLVGWAG